MKCAAEAGAGMAKAARANAAAARMPAALRLIETPMIVSLRLDGARAIPRLAVASPKLALRAGARQAPTPGLT